LELGIRMVVEMFAIYISCRNNILNIIPMVYKDNSYANEI